MNSTSTTTTLAPQPRPATAGAPPATAAAATETASLDARSWWRVPMVWVVIAGPLAVVIASLLTAVIAWRHIDPVIVDADSGRVIGHAGDEMAMPGEHKGPLAPAVRARNHTADARN